MPGAMKLRKRFFKLKRLGSGGAPPHAALQYFFERVLFLTVVVRPHRKWLAFCFFSSQHCQCRHSLSPRASVLVESCGIAEGFHVVTFFSRLLFSHLLCVSARSSGIQDLLCICAIHLPQCFVRKSETIQAPVIAEHAVFVKVLIRCFENSEGDSVHLLFESHVSSVEQTIGILCIKLRGKTGDRSCFR